MESALPTCSGLAVVTAAPTHVAGAVATAAAALVIGVVASAAFDIVAVAVVLNITAASPAPAFLVASWVAMVYLVSSPASLGGLAKLILPHCFF